MVVDIVSAILLLFLVMNWCLIDLGVAEHSDDDDDDDDEEGDGEEYDYDNSSQEENSSEASSTSSVYSDEPFSYDIYPCALHASHWPPHINNQRLPPPSLIPTHRLTQCFSLSPSLELYDTLMDLTPPHTTPERIQSQMCDILSEIATSSSDTLAATIDIYSHSSDLDPFTLSDLLNSHYHLLRPRDAPILQAAAAVLSDSDSSADIACQHHLQSLRILEREMIDTVQSLHVAVLPIFCHIDEEAHR